MVIQQFNKLIRNKWIWGAFAILVSIVFCMPDDWFSSRDGEGRAPGEAGLLDGEAVSSKDFTAIAEDVRGFGPQRDWKRDQGDVNRQAWETYAALKVAERNGLVATDAEVQAMIRRDPSFQVGGQFSFQRYKLLLNQNQIDEVRFEEYLRRRATLMRLGTALLASAAWGSPMEVDQAVADMTDTFTVKVATFLQSPADRDKVKLDEAGLRKWYDANTNSIALPERIKIRYVRYDATKSEILARMTVTEDEMRDRYDATVDRYTTTDTNGVEHVKKFEEVKGSIEKELRRIAAVQHFETNLNGRVYAKKAAKGLSRLDEIAKEDGLKVETSDWFSLEGNYQEGFMRRAQQILPGAENFLDVVSELDSSSEDLRYAVVMSDRAVWLVERAETSAKHVPTFAEAKDAIRPRALRAAQADAFRASVEAVAAKGVKAVEAVKGVSTNIVFCVSDVKPDSFPDQMSVVRAAMHLKAGEVSEFTLVHPGKAILVVCQKREAGDAAKAAILRSQVATDVTMLQNRQIPETWRTWNLERLGYETREESSVEKVAEEE